VPANVCRVDRKLVWTSSLVSQSVGFDEVFNEDGIYAKRQGLSAMSPQRNGAGARRAARHTRDLKAPVRSADHVTEHRRARGRYALVNVTRRVTVSVALPAAGTTLIVTVTLSWRRRFSSRLPVALSTSFSCLV
jgi:hypothetical protein